MGKVYESKNFKGVQMVRYFASQYHFIGRDCFSSFTETGCLCDPSQVHNPV
ncbi:hypothetical protein EA82_01620 [Enterococcus hirae]|uniref:hypothetical protein n=1 Tax=Enterococcus hirae TaxID=1354 RepID=UPI000DFC0820|nr:hypothetical protein [Enterococcus hirae]RBT68937.1 hypothetical protein EA82_01620 [Enterococcus hirae]